MSLLFPFFKLFMNPKRRFGVSVSGILYTEVFPDNSLVNLHCHFHLLFGCHLPNNHVNAATPKWYKHQRKTTTTTTWETVWKAIINSSHLLYVCIRACADTRLPASCSIFIQIFFSFSSYITLFTFPLLHYLKQ